MKICFDNKLHSVNTKFRAVGRSENQGVPVLFGGYNLPQLVDIELTDLPIVVSIPSS